MVQSFQRLRSGEPWRVNEPTARAIIESAEDFVRHRMDPGQVGPPQYDFEGTIVEVQNTSGSNQNRFAVLGIDGPIFDDSANLAEFQNYVRFKGVLPTAAHAGKFVVLIEPIANNCVGKAVVSGTVSVQIYCQSGGPIPTAADVSAGNTGYLIPAASGAQVLWCQTGGGPQWAIIRLPGSSGSPLRPVELTANHIPRPYGGTTPSTLSGVLLDEETAWGTGAAARTLYWLSDANNPTRPATLGVGKSRHVSAGLMGTRGMVRWNAAGATLPADANYPATGRYEILWGDFKIVALGVANPSSTPIANRTTGPVTLWWLDPAGAEDIASSGVDVTALNVSGQPLVSGQWVWLHYDRTESEWYALPIASGQLTPCELYDDVSPGSNTNKKAWPLKVSGATLVRDDSTSPPTLLVSDDILGDVRALGSVTTGGSGAKGYYTTGADGKNHIVSIRKLANMIRVAISVGSGVAANATFSSSSLVVMNVPGDQDPGNGTGTPCAAAGGQIQNGTTALPAGASDIICVWDEALGKYRVIGYQGQTIFFGLAQSDWTGGRGPGSLGSYGSVSVKLCNRDGGGVTGSAISVHLPRCGDMDPAVYAYSSTPAYPGDIIQFRYDADGTAIGVVFAQGPALGTIDLWSGADPSTIPYGWCLCDGSHGPDLRARFVMCHDSRSDARSDEQSPSTGGHRWHGTTENNHYDHSPHTHALSGWGGGDGIANTGSDYVRTTDNQVPAATYSAAQVIKHLGALNIETDLGDTDNRPRYYVLAYKYRWK